MRKKMAKPSQNKRNKLVQANAWIKPESRELIKEVASKERRSLASQYAVILDQFADCMRVPA